MHSTVNLDLDYFIIDLFIHKITHMLDGAECYLPTRESSLFKVSENVSAYLVIHSGYIHLTNLTDEFAISYRSYHILKFKFLQEQSRKVKITVVFGFFFR